jgi:hypothetical protein
MQDAYAGEQKKIYFCGGEMAEWSIAAVLKTVEGKTSGGSNPSLSARPVLSCTFNTIMILPLLDQLNLLHGLQFTGV